MSEYEKLRQQYRPKRIKGLLIAESPPPPADFPGARHFYRTGKARSDDRLYSNTMRALYKEAADLEDTELQERKPEFLERFRADGWYMTEALETSVKKAVKKPERQTLIRKALPRLLERVKELASRDTKLILIKSNVYDVAAEPLREAGFTVLNEGLVDFPGHYNQRAYREKLAQLAKQVSQ